jgi:hypothetical protein
MRSETSRTLPNEVKVVANIGLWYREDCISVNRYFSAKDFMKPANTVPTASPPGNCPTGKAIIESIMKFYNQN